MQVLPLLYWNLERHLLNRFIRNFFCSCLRGRFMNTASEPQAQQGQEPLQSKTLSSGQVRWKVV